MLSFVPWENLNLTKGISRLVKCQPVVYILLSGSSYFHCDWYGTGNLQHTSINTLRKKFSFFSPFSRHYSSKLLCQKSSWVCSFMKIFNFLYLAISSVYMPLGDFNKYFFVIPWIKLILEFFLGDYIYLLQFFTLSSLK